MREVSRELVAGSADVVAVENLRQTFLSLEEAREYVRGAGFDLSADRALYAIVRTTYAEMPHTRRRPMADLAPSTRRRYLASRQAQAEARAHGMTVEAWYERAPDLRAFRGHARGRRPQGAIFPRSENFTVYIARDYRPLSVRKRQRLSARTRRAWKARRQGGVTDDR